MEVSVSQLNFPASEAATSSIRRKYFEFRSKKENLGFFSCGCGVRPVAVSILYFPWLPNQFHGGGKEETQDISTVEPAKTVSLESVAVVEVAVEAAAAAKTKYR